MTLRDPRPRCTVLPKLNSIFVFAVPLYAVSAPSASPSGSSAGADAGGAKTILDMPHIEFELYGNQFCFRSADRASRKFKHKETIEL